MNGVQTRLKCKPNVKRCKRFVFAAHSPLLHPNTLKTKAIIHFQTDHILTRFVFPPLPAYEMAGASVLSILTDENFFGGNLKDIRAARPQVSLPILRKDFIIDEYQLYQACIVGADAVLLIAAALRKEQCSMLAAKAHELKLEVLLEIHSEQELEYIEDNIDMVGVNNRNLGTFHTDVENSFRLAEKLPKEMLLVSESGISSPQTVRQLRAAGFRGFLIGENFMKTPQPGNALKEFISKL